ncbi:MAG TPA: tetratricopeptide repeat protein [Candidatus Angelobacter sp.]|jgi:tetratricopeptide (TPR) repeat protein
MKRTLIWSLLLLVGLVSLSSVGQDSAWEASIQAGQEAMAKRQYSEAEKAFREALSAAERFGEKDARFSGTLLLLAQACDAQDKKEEAEALAGRAAEAMDKALKAHHPKQIEQQLQQADAASALFEKTGAIFASHQKHLEAESLYKKVVQIRENITRENPEPKNNEDFLRILGQTLADSRGKLAEANEKLGKLYFSENKLPEATATFEKAQKIREANPASDKRVLAQAITNVATCYAAQAKYERAEPLYLRALTLFEQANWTEKPETLETMRLYALLLKKTGRDAEANAMLEKVAAIRKKLGQAPR